MKKKLFYISILCMLILTVGCKKKKVEEPVEITEEIATETPTVEEVTEEPTKEVEEVTEEVREGQAKSLLTGEWVDEEIAKKRPYAIMFNNISYASPQSGTGEADIIYECMVEGGITRMMGIYGDLTDKDGNLLKRLGSVRSARHYYVSFAHCFDAIYVHYGETKYATKRIKNLGIDNLSGLTGIGNTVYYRDNSIKAPHNAFASGEGILKGTEKLKYRTDYKDGFDGVFKFAKKDRNLKSDQKVNKVTTKFSNYTSPYFVYDKESKTYGRYQFGGKHIDATTGEQLTYKNVIVQFVKEWNIDKNGYQTMDIENASGAGYYITNGKAIPIKWKENESKKSLSFYTEDDKELKLNPGKTFVSVFPNDRMNDVVFE